MKTLIALIVALVFGIARAFPSEDTLRIWCSPELMTVGSTWGEAFAGNNPDAGISVAMATGDRMKELIRSTGSVGLVTRDFFSENKGTDAWSMAVGRDVIVPVMNRQNPFFGEIAVKGISAEEFSMIYTAPDKVTWGKLINTGEPSTVKAYLPGDESAASYLAGFVHTDREKLAGQTAGSQVELLMQISADRYAIGFCRLADLMDTENHDIQKGLALIPIDLNANNRIDPFEDIYLNADALVRGIQVGKFPKSLYSRIYSITAAEPEGNMEIAFLEWLLSEGQPYLTLNAYSELTPGERQSGLSQLSAINAPATEVAFIAPGRPLMLLAVLVLLGGTVIAASLIHRRMILSGSTGGEAPPLSSVFREEYVGVPGGLLFDSSHTWVFMEKDGFVRAGIDDFLPHITGKITRVKMKLPGEIVKKGETFLSLVQNGKQIDIPSPVSGTIKENNPGLSADAALIYTDPLFEGWIYMIEPKNWLKESGGYVMGEKYRQWIRTEFIRLKDFLATHLHPESKGILLSVMQEGGEICEGALQQFGPGDWEEFQTHFINRPSFPDA